MSENEPVLSVDNLDHSFAAPGGDRLQVLRKISFEISRGESIAIRGSSGCGKTTLLLACGAMLQPTSGSVKVDGSHVYSLNARERVAFRARHIGYLFQTLELVPYLSLLDNLRIVKGVSRTVATEWLEKLGLADRMNHKPEALSHGQRQRAALARSLAHSPSLLVADEPTGNLDEENTQLVFETLREYAGNGGAVLVASHNKTVEDYVDRVLSIVDGVISSGNSRHA